MTQRPTPTTAPTRRQILGLSGALGASALLAACGGSSSSGSSGPASKDTKAEITYALWDQTQVKAIKANLVGFAKKYPDIKVSVDVTPYDTYFTKRQTEASSGTLPDLFWMNGPNFQLYADNDKLEPITAVVKRGDIDPKNYPPALVDLYTVDGTGYGVPKDFDTIGLWYNKAIFAQAGIPEPTGDWTWDDLKTNAAAISEKLKDQGIYGVAAGMDGQTTYYNTIFQAGGSVISKDGKSSGYDTPEAQAGIQLWTDLIASGASPNIKQLTDTTSDQWFVSGKVAMFYGGDWGRTAIADSPVAKDTGVAVLPKGVKRATVIHGVSNVVAKGGKNLGAAQALQAYLASKEAQQQQGDMGAIIPAFNGTQDAFAGSFPGVDLQIFLDEVKYSVPLPTSKNTAVWNAYETDLLPKAFSGAEPTGAVLKTLSTKMDAALAKA